MTRSRESRVGVEGREQQGRGEEGRIAKVRRLRERGVGGGKRGGWGGDYVNILCFCLYITHSLYLHSNPLNASNLLGLGDILSIDEMQLFSRRDGDVLWYWVLHCSALTLCTPDFSAL